MTARRLPTAFALSSAASMLLLTAGCSTTDLETELRMTPSNATPSDAAKATWNDANALAEATQEVVGGSWLGSDSAAEQCGDEGVRWGLTRLGPGTDPEARSDALAEIEALWTHAGNEPTRKAVGGDAPGLELRYPQVGTGEDGFFIEFSTTRHGSTLQLQTPCTPGDADSLNREHYGERHTNTPPDVPGAASPSASAEPTEGATP